jgi:hypothetical protein
MKRFIKESIAFKKIAHVSDLRSVHEKLSDSKKITSN